MGPKKTAGKPQLPKKPIVIDDADTQDTQDIQVVEEDVKASVNRARWSDEINEAMLETLHKAYRNRKGTDNRGFKADVWITVLEKVRRVYRGDGLLEDGSCRNKWQWFKDTWKLWKVLAGMSGFGWDEEEELYKADKEVWDNLAKVRLYLYSTNCFTNHFVVLQEY
jgi:hypothetical protein